MPDYIAGAAQTAQGTRRLSIRGFVGQLFASAQQYLHLSALNGLGQVAQVSTLTVSAATAAKVYTVTIAGIDVSYTAGGAPSTTTVALGLSNAIKAEPAIGAYVTASALVADVTVTGRLAGYAFTATEADAQLSWAATTAAVEAAALPFGLLCVTGGNYATNGEILLAGLPTGFAAQVDTLTFAYISGKILNVGIEIDGLTYAGEIVMATSKANSATLMLAQLNAVLPASTVIATKDGSDDIILTAEVLGASFVSTIRATDAANTLPVHSTTRSLLTSIADSFAGIVERDTSNQSQVIGSTGNGVPANHSMDLLTSCVIFVQRDSTQTPAFRGAVYVETSGADAGRLYTAGTSTRVLVPQLDWERSLSDNTATVRVSA